MFCTDLIKMPNHIYMQHYNNLLPCNTCLILHISTCTSEFIQISLVTFFNALTVEALDEWWVCCHPQLAALWDTFQPSAGRAGTPGPQQLVFSSDSAKAHWVGSGLVTASLLPILVPFLFFLPADHWEKYGQPSDSVLGRQNCPLPPCSRMVCNWQPHLRSVTQAVLNPFKVFPTFFHPSDMQN